jgi:hypothetical protein
VTRCAECSRSSGSVVDHAPRFSIDELAEFEHFLATRALLGRPLGRPDPDLPTKSGAVPSSPMASSKHRYRVMSTLSSVLTELGILARGSRPGQWVQTGALRIDEIAPDEIRAYILRRFPADPCRTHRDGCVRCCRPHHVSSYNHVCEAFRQLANFWYFEDTRYGKPTWTKERLRDVYVYTRRLKYKMRPPEINPVDAVLRFRAWLESEARPARSQDEAVRARALALYKKTRNVAEVARQLKVPHTTAYYWCSQAAAAAPVKGWRVRDDVARAHAYELWWLQEVGGRYEEIAHAEFPLEGPCARFVRSGSRLEILGKGVAGGKPRPVTLRDDQVLKLDGILAWRRELGKRLKAWTGRDPDPVLFVVLHDDPARAGRRYAEEPTSWNKSMKAWASRFNAWCEANGRPGDAINTDLVTSHKIGRAVSITRLARDGVAEKLIMEERGIEDHATLERYIRFADSEKKEILEAAHANGHANGKDTVDAKLDQVLGRLDRLAEENARLRAENEQLRKGATA